MYVCNMHMQRVDLKQVQREIDAKQSSILNIKGSCLDLQLHISIYVKSHLYSG